MQQSLFWFSLAKTKGPAMTWLAGWANNGPAFSADLGTEQGWEVIKEMQSISLTLPPGQQTWSTDHGPSFPPGYRNLSLLRMRDFCLEDSSFSLTWKLQG